MDFWERLDYLIETSATTRKAVTMEANIASNSISSWKARSTYPAADVIVKVAKHLGVSVEYLVTGEDNSDPWLIENAALIKKLKSLNEVQMVHIGSIIKAWDALNQDANQRAGAS